MSIVQTELVTCPHCRHQHEQKIARSINAGRTPAYRLEILAGTFQRPGCTNCHLRFEVNDRFLYVDMPRRQWFAVLPIVDSDVAEEESLLRESYRRVVLEAPPLVQELGAAMQLRVVFGLDALREKLVAMEAGIDDRVLEYLKVLLVAQAPDVFVGEGRLVATDDDLLLRWTDGVRSFDWRVARADYEAAAQPDGPAHGAFAHDALWVDAARLVV